MGMVPGGLEALFPEVPCVHSPSGCIGRAWSVGSGELPSLHIAAHERGPRIPKGRDIWGYTKARLTFLRAIPSLDIQAECLARKMLTMQPADTYRIQSRAFLAKAHPGARSGPGTSLREGMGGGGRDRQGHSGRAGLGASESSRPLCRG